MQVPIQSRHDPADTALHRSHIHLQHAAPVLDPQIFGSLRALLDAPTLHRLYTEMLKQTYKRLADLEQTSECSEIKAAAHSICGSAGMLGAAALAEAAGALEAHPAPAEGLSHAVACMRQGCAALQAALQEQQVTV